MPLLPAKKGPLKKGLFWHKKHIEIDKNRIFNEKRGVFSCFITVFSRLFNLCLPDVEKSSYFSFSFFTKKSAERLYIYGADIVK